MKEFIKIGVVLLVALSIILSTILFHPWINQQTVNDHIDEEYPNVNIRATLTDWDPYGHYFIVEIYLLDRWMKVGSGFVNIFSDVTDLEIDFN